MQRQGGGAYGAPLSYVNNSYREPSAGPGYDMLRFQPGLARPAIHATGGRRKTRGRGRSRRASTRKNMGRRHGGFYPSVMGSFTANGASLLPATIYSGYKLVKNYKGRTSTRRRRA